MATLATLKAKKGELVQGDPLEGKSVLDIPDVLQNNLRNLSQMERFLLTKKFEKAAMENSKMKMKMSQRLVKARAANIVSQAPV